MKKNDRVQFFNKQKKIISGEIVKMSYYYSQTEEVHRNLHVLPSQMRYISKCFISFKIDIIERPLEVSG